MARLVLPEHEIASRMNSLHVVFAPLRDGRRRLAFGRATGTPGGTVGIVAHEQKGSRLSYRSERFGTKVKALTSSYFELWRGHQAGTLYLDRAYFALYTTTPGTHRATELICLHTDPDDGDEFKRLPHLHFKCATEPIPHCHFPLELGFHDVVVKDVGELTSAMARAVGILAKEVVSRF